jgi:hypothetical protein
MRSTIARNIIGTLVVLCLVLGVVIHYLKSEDGDRRPAPQRITQLSGIRLGMLPTDVTLLLGRPSIAGSTEIDESGQAHLTYIYAKDHNADYALNITFYGPSRLSVQAVVVCENGGLSSLLGLDRYSSEPAVLGALGTPSHSSIRGDGLEKVISYDAWNASFKIARGKVVGICIHQGKFIQYDKESQVPLRPQVSAQAS